MAAVGIARAITNPTMIRVFFMSVSLRASPVRVFSSSVGRAAARAQMTLVIRGGDGCPGATGQERSLGRMSRPVDASDPSRGERCLPRTFVVPTFGGRNGGFGRISAEREAETPVGAVPDT